MQPRERRTPCASTRVGLTRRLALPLAITLFAACLPCPVVAQSPETPASPRDPFLEEVAFLLTETEREAYGELTRPYQRKAFERRFWEVRDPYPQTPRNELAERWHARWELVRSRYPDKTDERRRTLLLHGEPGRIVRLRCPQLVRSGEAWIYERTDQIPSGFVLVFLASGAGDSAPHRTWNARGGLRDAFTISSGASDNDAFTAAQVASECPRGDEILGLLQSAADWKDLETHFPVIPRVNAEWVQSFRSTSTDAPTDGVQIPAEVEVRFSGRNQSRTIVDAAVIVPASELSPAERAAGVVLDGEVLVGEELFESFRYRFDPPPAAPVDSAPTSAERLPFSARRYLRPGSYTLVLRLRTGEGRFFRSEQPLAVPVPGDPVASPENASTVANAAPQPPADPAASPSTPAAPSTSAAVTSEPRLRLLAPSDRLVSGRLRVEAMLEGFEAARVDFLLDGKPFLSKRRGPWSVDLELGRIPRMRRVVAVAFDAAGSPVAEDDLVVNGGPHRFAVTLVEPERAPAAGAPIEARARVDLPEGEALDRLEYWLDETRVATLFGPPWAATLDPGGAGTSRRVSYLRAIGYLASGVAAEDVRLLVGEGDSTAVDVDFVELYTSVLDRRGRPVTGLAESDFAVLEDGVAQVIRRFEVVDDAPIHAGVMIDTSASMLAALTDTRIAAERFIREIVTPRDRAAVFTFADAPRLEVRFTNDLEVLAGGLAGLGAEGETRLYDALAEALHYFSGVRGKRALVVLSDFADSGSRYRLEEILEYARRTGVAIYGIGLNLPRDMPEAGVVLDKLTRATGGRSFRITRAGELGAVYDAIGDELRAQYLIAYQSANADGSAGFREIRVDVDRPGAQARTLSGYFP